MQIGSGEFKRSYYLALNIQVHTFSAEKWIFLLWQFHTNHLQCCFYFGSLPFNGANFGALTCRMSLYSHIGARFHFYHVHILTISTDHVANKGLLRKI